MLKAKLPSPDLLLDQFEYEKSKFFDNSIKNINVGYNDK